MTIASYGNSDGTRCWASADTIAFDTGCGARCVSDHKAALEVAGYLSRDFRLNRVDDCTVHIPDHVWSEVQTKSAAFKEEKRNRASKGGWGSGGSKVDAAYDVKVDAAYAADDLSLTSFNTSSLPLEAPGEENKQFLKDDGPKLVRGQRKPIEDFKLRVAKLTTNKILFTLGQICILKKVLSEFTSDELFVGFRLAWDEISDDQIKYMASKFVANANVQAQQGRDVLLKKAAEREAIQRKTIEMQAEARAERVVRQKAREAEEALIEEELPE
jgi:hypothetical protein